MDAGKKGKTTLPFTDRTPNWSKYLDQSTENPYQSLQETLRTAPQIGLFDTFQHTWTTSSGLTDI